MSGRGMDRREFVRVLGGGIVVFVTLGPTRVLAQQPRGYPEDLNAYLRIDGDGRVWIFSGKIEMGQGVMTSLAQMAAEELGVPLESITMVMGDTDQCPWDMGTFGSMSTRFFGPALRAAAAEGRTVLTQLAAAKLGVAKDALTVADGTVYVTADRSKKVTYAELAQGRRISRLVGEKAITRAAKDFQVMGRSPKRLDARDKVTGRARYAADVRLPGMLYAAVLRPPSHASKLASVDVSAAQALPGVQVVQDGDLVAVLHERPDAAAEAATKIRAEWQTPQTALDQETIFDHLVQVAPAPDVRLSRGDVVAARAGRVFESTFRAGYRAHAPMEPHAAIAEVKDGRLTAWVSTQTPFPVRDSIARTLGMQQKDVRVLTPFVGGGFGGKSASGQAIEAARLARLAGKPVQVAWSRAEEFFNDTFDPAAVVKIVSALDATGRITLWDYKVYAAGERGSALFYDIPNASIRVFGSWGDRGGSSSGHPFAVGAWRAPGANTNVFASESQVDVMAAAARIDPLEFRLRNTSDPRMRSVLQAAAAAFGWSPAPGPSGKGRAIACGIDAGTYVAVCAQVTVDRKTGAVKVDRLVGAQDMGVVVNPDGAKMQMEGCMTMGLGYALSEEIRFSGGQVLDRNFGTYRLPKFSWVPKIETVLVKNDAITPQGGGEPCIVPMGAVLANAVFDATGARLYRLPLTPQRVLAAMSEKA